MLQFMPQRYEYFPIFPNKVSEMFRRAKVMLGKNCEMPYKVSPAEAKESRIIMYCDDNILLRCCGLHGDFEG